MADDVETAPEWLTSIEDADTKAALSRFESQDSLLQAIGYAPPEDWRESITDEKAKEFAKSSTDVKHLVQRALDMRQKLSTAIVRPGKNATPEERSAYHKAIGVPSEPSEYEFPEVEEVTDELKSSREARGARFLELEVPKATAAALIQMVNEDAEREAERQAKADQEFVKASEDALKSEWKGDYEQNKTIANRAFADIATRAGLDLESLGKIETKDGRFLMDRPEMAKLFATIGREMTEGTLGQTLTTGERETIENEIESLREGIAKAQREGNSKKANALYQKEQALLEKMSAESRAA